MQKKIKVISLLFVLIFIVSCSHSVKQSNENVSDTVEANPLDQDDFENQYPKIAIVLGPGGARTQAQIGFLRVLEREQIPISYVVGYEWGAVIGSLFSMKGKSNEAEWQLSKLDPDFFEKKLLSSSQKTYGDIKPTLKKMFSQHKLEDSKIPFSCPGFQYANLRSQFFEKGQAAETLGFCLPHPPLMKASAGWIADLISFSSTIQFLKSKNINYIIYLDVLGSGPIPDLKFEDAIYWSYSQSSLKFSSQNFQKIVQIPVKSSFSDFKNRNSLISAGEQEGKKFVDELKNQIGL